MTSLKQNTESTTRQFTRRYFESFDQTKLSFLHWPSNDQAKGAIILIHRGHEHAERLIHIPQEANFDQYDVYAIDMRGHGESEGADTNNLVMEHFVRDLNAFCTYLKKRDGVQTEDISLIGQSVGAVVAATWVNDYSPKIKTMVLAAPAFEINLFVPFAESAIRLAQKAVPELKVKSYVSGKMLTQDAERARTYHTDTRITRDISARLLIDLRDTARRVVEGAHDVRIPTLILVAGDDHVVNQKPIEAYYDGLCSEKKELKLLDGFLHDILGEKERRHAFNYIVEFI